MLLPPWAKKWFWKQGQRNICNLNISIHLQGEKPLSFHVSEQGAGYKSQSGDLITCIIKKGSEWRINFYQSVCVLKASEKSSGSLTLQTGWSSGVTGHSDAAQGLSLGSMSMVHIAHIDNSHLHAILTCIKLCAFPLSAWWILDWALNLRGWILITWVCCFTIMGFSQEKPLSQYAFPPSF